MSIAELQILLDLNYENEVDVLKEHTSWITYDYLFVDSDDGHCYLFDENGKIDDIKKLKVLNYTDVKLDIKKIVIPESVKNIEYDAFKYCSSLKSVKIPENVKYIGYCAFYDCISHLQRQDNRPSQSNGPLSLGN